MFRLTVSLPPPSMGHLGSDNMRFSTITVRSQISTRLNGALTCRETQSVQGEVRNGKCCSMMGSKLIKKPSLAYQYLLIGRSALANSGKALLQQEIWDTVHDVEFKPVEDDRRKSN